MERFIVGPFRRSANIVALGGAVPTVERDEAGLEAQLLQAAEELFALTACKPNFKSADAKVTPRVESV